MAGHLRGYTDTRRLLGSSSPRANRDGLGRSAGPRGAALREWFGSALLVEERADVWLPTTVAGSAEDRAGNGERGAVSRWRLSLVGAADEVNQLREGSSELESDGEECARRPRGRLALRGKRRAVSPGAPRAFPGPY
jgi:hypothetical protein